MPKGKGKRHTPEQIVAILRRAESGETATTVCRETNISGATFYRWKSQNGGMQLACGTSGKIQREFECAVLDIRRKTIRSPENGEFDEDCL